MPLYLGFDASTQSLTGIVLEIAGSTRRVAFQRSLTFDAEFPRYGTRNGVLPPPTRDPLVASSPPLMWVEALGRFMQILKDESGLDLTQLRAVSGAAQQHGSVYLNAQAKARLAALDPAQPLVGQVSDIVSRADAPIWMDASTTAQCAAITQAVGGDDALARLTGSRAFERFTGPQIRKFAERDPAAYAATDRIHLVSSFLASLLIGRHAPTEPGDAAGMNLMDISAQRWSDVAVRATAPDLARKLPDLVPPWSVIGRLARYWVERYGLPPADVVAWTGDNPSSLVGVGLVNRGRVAISLGTSDTVFGLMNAPQIDASGNGVGHLFGAPTGDYMALVCFKNGSLARERVRDAYGLDWDGFARALRDTPPGNRGAIMLPWFEAEITPPVLAPGVRRYGLDAADAAANVRAVIEAQMMATARHAGWIGERIVAIHATGGAARNRDILQVMADVHDADVYQLEVGEAAALGAALRAFHGDELARGRPVSWEDVVAGFVEPAAHLQPDPRNVAIYTELKQVYAACEAHALGRGPAPMSLQPSGAHP
ncbi:MAG TPA: FGGY-family carbohydrate kinase [Gemmatimonadales bacterium]|nr:FGGY-family carbohydrate kinase [Gemmatimonadales bacterium]